VPGRIRSAINDATNETPARHGRLQSRRHRIQSARLEAEALKSSSKYRSPMRRLGELAAASRTGKAVTPWRCIYPTMTSGEGGGGGKGIDVAVRSWRRSSDRDAPSARSLFRSFIPFAITTSAARSLIISWASSNRRPDGRSARGGGGSLESGPDGTFRALSAAASAYVTVLAGLGVVALGSWR